MKLMIDTIDLAEIIYIKFVGDCEGRTACGNFCAGNSCIAAIEMALIEEIKKRENDEITLYKKLKML